ncbi:MAG: flagellar biosynthetic protein FliO [Bacillota bacterium]
MGDAVATGIRLAVGLAIVIVLINLAGIALRAVQHKGIGTRGRPAMEIRESLGLGPGRALHIVRVADRFLVVGATGTHITLITEVGGESLEGERRLQPGPSRERAFGEILDAYARRFSDEGVTESETDGGGSA